MRCSGWETTTPPARNEGECRRSKSQDDRAQGSGTDPKRDGAAIGVIYRRSEPPSVEDPPYQGRPGTHAYRCQSIPIDVLLLCADQERDRGHPVAGPRQDSAIFPESGKARGEGNGWSRSVRLCGRSPAQGWEIEMPFPLEGIKGGARFGPMDAAKRFGSDPPLHGGVGDGTSPSHRSMNKLALGLIEGVVSGGVLIVPMGARSALTDRIGNVRELEPYFRSGAQSVPLAAILA